MCWQVPIIILGNKIDVPASGNARVEVTHLASKLQKDRGPSIPPVAHCRHACFFFKPPCVRIRVCSETV